MKLRRLTASLAVAASLAMSVNAFAAGSITGKYENVVIRQENGEEISGATVQITEEFNTEYFGTDEGSKVKDTIEAINNGTMTITEAIPDLKKDDDVTVDVGSLSMLTKMSAVVVRDKDGNIIEDAKNVVVSFDLTNIPDGADLYVLTYDATDGYTLRKVKKGGVLGDSVRAILDGDTISILFSDLKGASFAILYTTSEEVVPSVTPGSSDNGSSNTGSAGRVLPIALAAIVAGSAAVVIRKKRA